MKIIGYKNGLNTISLSLSTTCSKASNRSEYSGDSWGVVGASILWLEDCCCSIPSDDISRGTLVNTTAAGAVSALKMHTNSLFILYPFKIMENDCKLRQ